MMLGQVVKVQKERIAACMTCPLCNKLFREATTISECLHTFCRKCIDMKISDEELDSCPVCDIKLGCSPLEKLRADHSLQDLRARIFPSKRKKAREPATVSSVPEAVPVQESEHSVPLIGRRKERSLSSLVVSTPKISVKSVLTGKRSKSVARKRESPIPVEEQIKKVDDYYESLSSPETLRKIAQTKRQNSSTAESSKQQKPNKLDVENDVKPCKEKIDLWKPLNCLVEAATKTKSNKSDLQEIIVQIKKLDAQEEEAQALKTSIKEHGDKSKVIGEESNSTSSPSGSVKPRRLQAMRQKREGFNIPARAAVEANSNCDRRFSPIWLSLVASDEEEGVAPLPQISSCYLRVKDGSLPVSHIKKYLVQKLGLVSEAEVEILLLGQPVASTLQLHNLVDWWSQTASASERIQTTVGSSAEDFVMVLSYGRKVSLQKHLATAAEFHL
ncbi:PREDICTED: E3 ubiquitin protein ligase DRIP2-like isoform X1 [Populus euphratica]|uniref:E3 ubiquitin protein ligase DRIP2-like isoform X1 n=1 Tax=Populus euphratica TaxID=75702 RepID=A0AAJ6UII9_POPEU|nr:PREDICTED: E3 ubiquitin protein ligase DRIP2-like isoform X1 [Populus euphratica]